MEYLILNKIRSKFNKKSMILIFENGDYFG